MVPKKKLSCTDGSRPIRNSGPHIKLPSSTAETCDLEYKLIDRTGQPTYNLENNFIHHTGQKFTSVPPYNNNSSPPPPYDLAPSIITMDQAPFAFHAPMNVTMYILRLIKTVSFLVALVLIVYFVSQSFSYQVTLPSMYIVTHH
jgi:hypothetical protein